MPPLAYRLTVTQAQVQTGLAIVAREDRGRKRPVGPALFDSNPLPDRATDPLPYPDLAFRLATNGRSGVGA